MSDSPEVTTTMPDEYFVDVRRSVKVFVDKAKFTPQFMEEYRASFAPYYDLHDHIKHLGWLYATGRIDGWPGEFIEGYGPAQEMGIRFEDDGSDETEVRP